MARLIPRIPHINLNLFDTLVARMEGKKQTVFVGREVEVDREDMPS
jgi:hypothetical protein